VGEFGDVGAAGVEVEEGVFVAVGDEEGGVFVPVGDVEEDGGDEGDTDGGGGAVGVGIAGGGRVIQEQESELGS
jgi:hypothetical protein